MISVAFRSLSHLSRFHRLYSTSILDNSSTSTATMSNSVHRASADSDLQPVSRDPLLVVVGATGTGKSELAVSLAKAVDGEVINGDAVQMYAGLPIATNKMPEEERAGVVHHLLGNIPVEAETWTVGNFVTEAKRIIADIHSRGKIPVLVGGTHYYTQSLLFNNTSAPSPDSDSEGDGNPAKTTSPQTKLTIETAAILEKSTEEILRRLREVDPTMADRWHPNDRRKIQRSLEIYLQTGKTASETYRLQQKAAEEENLKSSLRYPTLLFWPYVSPSILNARLDGRVDKMVKNGLLDECRQLNSLRCKIDNDSENPQKVDITRGIWVSIGYKEFLPYFEALENASGEECKSVSSAFESAVEKTQVATRQYAKRQLRWLRIKLLNALLNAKRSQTSSSMESHSNAPNPLHYYILPYENLSDFEEQVLKVASDLSSRFLGEISRWRAGLERDGVYSNFDMPQPESLASITSEISALLNPSREDLSKRMDLWERKECSLCSVVATTAEQWRKHIEGRQHRMKSKKMSKGDKWRQEQEEKRAQESLTRLDL